MIDLYSQRLQPVSSEEMAKRLQQAPSTLRKDLQELERLGFIRKANASSGRIPTNKAIRHHINSLYSEETNAPVDGLVGLDGADGDFSIFSRRLLHALALETQSIGFVMFDSLFDLGYRGIQIVKTGNNQVMMVIQALNGLSFSKIFSTRSNYSEQELHQWGKLLTSEFKGKTLNQSIRCIGNRISRDKGRYLAIYRELLSLLDHNDLKTVELLYEGETHFSPSRDHNPLELQQILLALKEKSMLIRFLLDMRRQEKRGPQVAFGDETRMSGLDNCLFLFSPLYLAAKTIGDLGVIGPRYMPYADTVSQVNRFSHFFSRKLTGPLGRN